MASKKSNTTRICSINVNGIGVRSTSEKSKALQRWMDSKKVDVMCISETNVNWSRVRTKDTFWERKKGWFEHRAVGVSYNAHDKELLKRKQ